MIHILSRSRFKTFLLVGSALLIHFRVSTCSADEFRIGVIASLTGFAAPYGKAVLDGVATAKIELEQSGVKIKLFIEDDQSQSRVAATAYKKLRSINKVQGLIGGSWWINGIVKTVEKDHIPFISCETLYDKDFVKAENYFTLAGDLREWIKAFDPLIDDRGWKSAAMIRFVSGFADTLEEQLRKTFSINGRTFTHSFTYTDIDATSASTFATQTLALNTDIIFIDAQPESFGNIAKELQKQAGNRRLHILSHSVAGDAIKQNLFDIKTFPGEIFFLNRSTYTPEFKKLFNQKIGKEPELNSDLGYYATQLLASSLKTENPIAALKSGITVSSQKFIFDENNVSNAIKQQVFKEENGEIVLLDLKAIKTQP